MINVRDLLNILTEFDSIYKRLGVTLVERGESFYQPLMGDIVADLEGKSKLAQCHHHPFASVFIFLHICFRHGQSRGGS